MKVAIVHEWLTTLGGSELVLRELLRVFPDATVFTLIEKMADEDRAFLGVHDARTSFLDRVPRVGRFYRSLLPMFPVAVRSLDVREFDVVVSNSHAVAKGVRTHDRQLHVCYCLSPMRYAWDLREQYLRESGLAHGAKGFLARGILDVLQRWDASTSDRVDVFATLSHYIADRIRRAYGRDSTVVYPPVDTEFFTPGPPAESPSDARGEYYFTASRFVPYKRIDLIARAFASMPDRRLIIAGDGPDAEKIRAAAGSNVTLVGRVDRVRLRELLRGARAFLFAAEEDFGIVPVEAQACGTPVIAFGKGGACETVTDDTGVFFLDQTTDAIVDAVERFEQRESRDTAAMCRRNAERFGEARFRAEMTALVEREWAAFSTRRRQSASEPIASSH